MALKRAASVHIARRRIITWTPLYFKRFTIRMKIRLRGKAVFDSNVDSFRKQCWTKSTFCWKDCWSCFHYWLSVVCLSAVSVCVGRRSSCSSLNVNRSSEVPRSHDVQLQKARRKHIHIRDANCYNICIYKYSSRWLRGLRCCIWTEMKYCEVTLFWIMVSSSYPINM